MTLLSELNTLISALDIPVETGIFKGAAPDVYAVIVPMSDRFELHADNSPGIDIQEARISLFSKGAYTAKKNAIVRSLLANDFTVTSRLYNGYDTETGYHHYVVDAAKYYETEE